MKIIKLILNFLKLSEKKNHLRMICFSFLSGFTILITLIYPYFLKILIDNLIEKKFIDSSLFLYLIFYFLLIVILGYLSRYYSFKYSIFSALDIRENLLKNFINIPKNEINIKGESYYSRIINEEISMAIILFNETMFVNLFLLIRMFFTIVVIFKVNYLIGLISLIIILSSIIQFYLNKKYIPIQVQKVNNKLGEILSIISETIYNNDIIKNYNFNSIQISKYKKESLQLIKFQLDQKRYENKLETFFSNIPIYLCRVLILFYISKNIILNKMSIGDLSMIIGYLSFIENPIGTFTFWYSMFFQSYGTIERIMKIYKEIKEKNELRKNDINFRKEFLLYFNDFELYIEGNKIISNLNYKIKDKIHLGIVGLSASGKTSFINTLMGNNDNYKGNIYLFNCENELRKINIMKYINLYT